MPNWKDLLHRFARVGATLLLVAVASFAGWRLWQHYQKDPWTRDGRVRADIVQIAPDVAGLVTEVSVKHDQRVKAGQTLFTIDRARYELAIRQADSAIATAEAAIEVQKAAVKVQKASIEAHRASLAEAQREAARNDQLGSLVSREVTEQSHSRVAVEQAALAQSVAAEAQAASAATQAETAVAQAEAARAVASLNLDRTLVKAPTDGMLSDINVRVGDYVSPGKPALALIDASSLRIEGYFEETKLPNLRIGQKAQVILMGEQQRLSGHVVSIAGAIEDRERGASTSGLPNVNPTFSWVRLAQRIPVRIALDQPPADLLLIAGRTATVTIEGTDK